MSKKNRLIKPKFFSDSKNNITDVYLSMDDYNYLMERLEKFSKEAEKKEKMKKNKREKSIRAVAK